ncbi:hypothetical protein B0H13DRAFT_2383284 [Mycena leptocephala]|nr:hypothetical protein B0H13DRAFT_2383284 [Mycena leptocephala]
MLCSHRIPCSRVPAPLFVFLRRATPSHFRLHERPSHGYSISTAQYTARCFPHTRSHFRCALAVSRTPTPLPARLLAVSRTPTPACISAATSFPARPLAVSRTPTSARISAARSLFPHAHARSHFRCVLAVPTRPPARAPARFLLRLALPPPPRASPPPRAPLRLTGEAEPGAERDKNWL